MNILAIDSSTEACSAALLREDGLVFSEFELAPRQHTRLLPLMMNKVIADADIYKRFLSHCAFANGPGAFTGIRIAAAQAQGIGIALGIPLLPVSTLAVLAQAAMDRLDCARPLVALDARMQEVYWALYRRNESGLAELIGEERLTAVDQVSLDADADCGVGHGWLDPLSNAAGFSVDVELLPDARSLLKLARDAVLSDCVVDAGKIGINYLRNRVAEKAAS